MKCTCVLLGPGTRVQFPQLASRKVPLKRGVRRDVGEPGELVSGDPLVLNKAGEARKDVKYGLESKL